MQPLGSRKTKETVTMKKRQIFINVAAMAAVCVALIFLVEFVSYLAVTFYQNKTKKVNSQSAYGAKNFGEEQKSFMTEYRGTANIPYKSFVGWQPREYHGKYINVNSNGLRITGYENKKSGGRTVHFFGGSTMWGFGLADDGTIPAIIGQRTSFNTVNYAELAWNSRQSLNRLMEYLKSIKPNDIVIFYDGINDASYSCYPNTVGANAREHQINSALNAVSYGDRLYMLGVNTFVQNTFTFIAYNNFLKKASSGSPPPASSCDDPAVAQAAADFLIQSWEIAAQIVKERGASFACILQPTPYTSVFSAGPDTALPVSHESLSIKDVYPLVRKGAAHLPCFSDFSEELHSDYYFDFQGHVTREGNSQLVNLLINKVIDK